MSNYYLNEVDIVKNIINEELGSKYRLESYYNKIVYEKEDLAYKSTEEMIAEIQNDNRVRGVVKTSASNYLALKDTNSVSFSWQIDLYADIKDNFVLQDFKKLKDKLNDTVLDIVSNIYNSQNEVEKVENFNCLLTFNMPICYDAKLYNGREYKNVILTGACTLRTNSMLGNDTRYFLTNKTTNERIEILNVLNSTTQFSADTTALLKESCGYAKDSTVIACNHSISFNIHATFTEEILKLIKIIDNYKNNLVDGHFASYELEIVTNNIEKQVWEDVIFKSGQVIRQRGGFVDINFTLERND